MMMNSDLSKDLQISKKQRSAGERRQSRETLTTKILQ